MAKSRADDALCIDCLHLFTLLFLNYTSSVLKINDALLRKIEIQFRFFCFFFWCGGLDHLSTRANSSYSVQILETFSIDGALTAHTFSMNQRA